MKAIVTGASGFVGKSLVTELLGRGWDVACLGRRRLAPKPRMAWHMADLGDPAGFASALRACGKSELLFHLAAAMPTHRPAPDDDTLVRANVLSPLRLFREAVEMGIPRVVFASSISVIGTPKSLPITEDHPVAPISSYGITKLGGELYAEMLRQTSALNVVSLRLTSCYGPGMHVDSVLPYFVTSALEGRKLTWFGTGARRQNFVHLRDVTRALLLAAESPAVGVVNIGGAHSISMKELAQLIVTLTRHAGSVAEAAGKPDPQDDLRWEIDLSRAKAALGFVPRVSLRDGVEEYLEHASGAHLRHSR